MNEDFKLYTLFNNKTRKFVCFTFDVSVFPEIIRNNMLIKEYSFKELGITDENINITRFKWIGDYDNGRLVDIVLEKKALVTETEIEEKYDSMFFDKFDIKEVIFEIILNCDMKTENGKKIQTFLSKVLDKKNKDIEYFKNSPLHIWETKDEVNRRSKDAFSS